MTSPIEGNVPARAFACKVSASLAKYKRFRSTSCGSSRAASLTEQERA